MRYQDENGDFQEIYFKASDTLPIGTEVDYDGEEVPFGWEEITSPFAVVEGTVINKGYGDDIPPIDYPTGFTSDNCVAIGGKLRWKLHGDGDYGDWCNLGVVYVDASTGKITFRDFFLYEFGNVKKIYYSFFGEGDSQSSKLDYQYKIVLMKIPTQTQGGNE